MYGPAALPYLSTVFSGTVDSAVVEPASVAAVVPAVVVAAAELDSAFCDQPANPTTARIAANAAEIFLVIIISLQ